MTTAIHWEKRAYLRGKHPLSARQIILHQRRLNVGVVADRCLRAVPKARKRTQERSIRLQSDRKYKLRRKIRRIKESHGTSSQKRGRIAAEGNTRDTRVTRGRRQWSQSSSSQTSVLKSSRCVPANHPIRTPCCLQQRRMIAARSAQQRATVTGSRQS